MATEESIEWELGKAPKQSITELLHNPRGPTLELPDVTLELPALSLTPVPPAAVPQPYDINRFESFLRRYAPLYEAYESQKISTTEFPEPLDIVPSHYFEPTFKLSNNPDLAAVASDARLSENPLIPKLHQQLSLNKATLEHHLQRVLDEQNPAITSALTNVESLRQSIISTASALSETRRKAEEHVPAVVTPIAAVQRLTQAQANLHVLKSSLRGLQVITSTPKDVAILVDAGEYAAAIDAVQSAREELKAPHLARQKALAPVRARLAQSVEAIDAALRRQFREALADTNHSVLRDVVALVSRLGRLTTLHRFFMREIKHGLSKSFEEVSSLSQASRVLFESAESAVMLIEIIHGDQDSDAGVKLDRLREAHSDFEEMLTNVADRMLVSPTGDNRNGFVVITRPEALTQETCFDEFKAALKFCEEIRTMDELASKLERLFGIEKRGGPLRAKVSERQISFLSAFHNAHTDALTQTVRSDKWQEVRVPEGARRLLRAVIRKQDSERDNTAGLDSNRSTNGKKIMTDDGVEDGTVMLGGASFRTVASGVRYLRSICAYTLLAEESSYLASKIARRGADYSRNFNSLVGKAILGAAALQWAGLRSITARHLSLASRTIAMSASLADYVNGPLESSISGAQADVILPLLKKSTNDLRDHHRQLLAKILAIMMDRLEAHETTLKSLPWEKQQEMQRFDAPSAYVTTLSKEATVLHRILWSILPSAEVFDIFQRVCAAYGSHLTAAYSSLDGRKAWIRSRVAKDVAYLHEKLLALDVFKVNTDSFLPLSQLYDRFAREVLEEEAKLPGGRSFNRQAEKKIPMGSARNSATPHASVTAEEQNAATVTEEQSGNKSLSSGSEEKPKMANGVSEGNAVISQQEQSTEAQEKGHDTKDHTPSDAIHQDRHASTVVTQSHVTEGTPEPGEPEIPIIDSIGLQEEESSHTHREDSTSAASDAEKLTNTLENGEADMLQTSAPDDYSNSPVGDIREDNDLPSEKMSPAGNSGAERGESEKQVVPEGDLLGLGEARAKEQHQSEELRSP